MHIKHAYVLESGGRDRQAWGRRHLTEAEQGGIERHNLNIVLKAKELVAGKSRRMEKCRG